MAGSQGIRAGRAYVELGTDDQLTRGLRAAEKRLKAFGASVQQVGQRMMALGAGVITPLVGAAKVFGDMGDRLDKMAARTGVSVEALSELSFAAEQSGADLETLETGLRKMQRTVVDAAQGSKSAQEALATLGLTVADLDSLSPEQQFKRIADQLSKIEDPTTRAALAMELFGKTGTRLLPMLKDGAAGIEALQHQARDFGLTVSTQSAKDAALFTDTVNILWRTLKQAVFTIGSALSPLLTDLANRAARVMVVVIGWIEQNKALIVTVLKVAAAVAAAGAGLIAAGVAIKGLALAVGGLATVTGAAASVIKIATLALGALLSPVGLITAAVAALGTALLVTTDRGVKALAWLGDTFSWLRDTALIVFEGISDALAAADLRLAAEVLWAGLRVVWEKGIDTLRRPWIEFSTAVQRAGINAFAGLKKAWIGVSTYFWQNFPETTAFIARTWANMLHTMRGASAAFQTWLTKVWIDIGALFSDLTAEQVAEAKRLADQDFMIEIEKVEKQRQSDLDAIDRKKSMTPEELEAEKARELAEVEAERLRALAELDDAYAERLVAAEEALAAAEKVLADARERARNRRRDAKAIAAPKRRDDLLSGLEDRIVGLGNALAAKLSTVGTFNPLALAGLGTTSTLDRLARSTEQTARNTKRLADAAQGGRLVFVGDHG